MPTASSRSPTRAEKARITAILRRLREHFPEWPTAEGLEHHLVGFAYYEGCGDSECCGEILAEAAPLALGVELVANHGFSWVMVTSEAPPRYGVAHPAFDRPIDLGSLEDGTWNEEEYDEPTDRGRTTHDSLKTIVKRVTRKPRGS